MPAELGFVSQMLNRIGSKAAAAVESVSSTASLVAYIKGLIQELDQRSVSKASQDRTNQSSWKDIVNITDKGVLTGISQWVTSDGTGGGLQIIIDGLWILSIDSGPNSGFSMNYASASLAFNHRFNTSLRVQHEAYNGAGYVNTTVSYTIDS